MEPEVGHGAAAELLGSHDPFRAGDNLLKSRRSKPFFHLWQPPLSWRTPGAVERPRCGMLSRVGEYRPLRS
jgi:hypothetical protein